MKNVGFLIDRPFLLALWLCWPIVFCLHRVSDEKSYWGALVCDDLLLASCFQGLFFVLPRLGHNVSQNVSLWVHLTWSLLSLLDVYIHNFYKTWEFFRHCFYKYALGPSLLLFSGTPQCVCLSGWQYSTGLLGYLYYNLFFFCFSDSEISIMLSPNSLILLPVQIWLWIPL